MLNRSLVEVVILLLSYTFYSCLYSVSHIIDYFNKACSIHFPILIHKKPCTLLNLSGL